MCFYDMKARYKASLLTATRKLENIFRWWAADWQSNGRVLDPDDVKQKTSLFSVQGQSA